jgi:hypothetical protein
MRVLMEKSIMKLDKISDYIKKQNHYLNKYKITNSLLSISI